MDLLERQKPPTPSTSTSRSNWIGTIEFSEWLGIHPQTVRAIKKMENGPWRRGVHFRTTGITGRGPIQWNRDAAEQAFTEFQQTPAVKVETFSRVPVQPCAEREPPHVTAQPFWPDYPVRQGTPLPNRRLPSRERRRLQLDT